MNPHYIADQYFHAMRTGDLETLLSIFTEDGVIVWPNGQAFEGKDAIRATYAQMFSRPLNNPQPDVIMVGPDRFATQVTTHLASGEARRTINIFRVNGDGLVTRMDSYRQD